MQAGVPLGTLCYAAPEALRGLLLKTSDVSAGGSSSKLFLKLTHGSFPDTCSFNSPKGMQGGAGDAGLHDAVGSVLYVG